MSGIQVFVDRADDPPEKGGWSGVYVTTNQRGAYRMGLRPGPYQVILIAREGNARVPDAYLDTVSLTKSVTNFDYKYSCATIRGTIVGPKARPVASGVIKAVGSEAASHRGVDVQATIQNGQFVFFLRPGEYGVKSDSLPPGLPMASWLDLRVSGDTTLHIDASGHRVHGRVALGSEVPMAGAKVVATGNVGGSYKRAEVVTDHDGTYEVFLPNGSYGLTVRPSPFQAFISAKSLEREIRGPARLDIDMSGVEWRGTVRDSAGAVRDSLIVGVYYGSSKPWAEDVTRAGGRFRVVVQSWGTYSVVVMKSDRTRLREWTGIPARRDSTLDLVLGK